MYRILNVIVLISTLMFSKPIFALQLFACEPEWASLAEELSGGLNDITTALTVQQDPHRLQAKPSLIATIRKANLIICSGADLEIGWLPLLLRRSGNRQIQPGQSGYFEASSFVKRLEIPAQLDRSQGDLHPQGNPHVHLDPRNISLIARALTQRLIELDPGNSIEYQRFQQEFEMRWKASIKRWKQEARPLHGMKLITHHTSFSYLLNAFGILRVGTLESKPGIPPGSAHLASLLSVVENQEPSYLIRAPYEDPHPSEWLSGKTGLTMIELPYSVDPGGPATNLFELFDLTLKLLLEEYEH